MTITELERLKLSVQKSMHLLGCLPVYLMMIDLNGSVTHVSMTFAELTGYDPTDDIYEKNKTIEEFFEYQPIAQLNLMDFILQNCIGRNCHARMRKKDGTYLPVFFTCTYYDEQTVLACILKADLEPLSLESR